MESDFKITVVGILECGQPFSQFTPFRVIHYDSDKFLEATLERNTKMFLPITEDNLNCELFRQVSYENLFAEVAKSERGIEYIRVIIK
jgi:hypothetical protein